MRLAITVATMLVWMLAGCGPESAQPPRDQPAAEPENVSSKDFGDYVLHFNAITTDELQPEIAKNYNIARSKNRAMLTVSIIRKHEGTTGKSVPGSVTASAVNLTGQLKSIALRQIEVGDAYYYIGDIPVVSEETLIFSVDATPINETSRFSVRFSRRFFGK